MKNLSITRRAFAVLVVASMLLLALSPTPVYGGFAPSPSLYLADIYFKPPGEWIAEEQDGVYRASGEICNDTFRTIEWISFSSSVKEGREHLVENVELIYNFYSMWGKECYPFAVEITMTDAWLSEPDGFQVRIFIDAEAYT